jgi:hypothetical protein
MSVMDFDVLVCIFCIYLPSSPFSFVIIYLKYLFPKFSFNNKIVMKLQTKEMCERVKL